MNRPELVIAPDIQIEPLKATDVNGLLPILREHVRDRDTGEVIESEIQEIQGYMQGKKDEHGRVRNYVVARGADGRVYGCMAYSTPDPDITRHFKRDPRQAAQLLNVFVSRSVFRGGGIGKKLLREICRKVRNEGKRELWVSSSVRYDNSWIFYDKEFDENMGFIFRSGEHGDANTWLKRLV